MGHPSRTFLFHLEPDKGTTLQAQLRRMLVSAILDGQIPPGSPLPSCRALAQSLKIARNTVVLAYQDLVEEGFLIARERSGFFANADILGGRVRAAEAGAQANEIKGPAPRATPDWQARFRLQPGAQRNIVKPANWQDFPYPFIYGQVDQGLFPLAA
ncbi:MAG TPA: winged helix-turn-helix domain-containing protein, partial [Dongiaceae bacterium]